MEFNGDGIPLEFIHGLIALEVLRIHLGGVVWSTGTPRLNANSMQCVGRKAYKEKKEQSGSDNRDKVRFLLTINNQER